MTAEDFIKFCREARLLDNSRVAAAELPALVAALAAEDDDALEAAVAESAARHAAAVAQLARDQERYDADRAAALTAGGELPPPPPPPPPMVCEVVEASQPEPRPTGLGFAGFLDALAGVAAMKAPLPTQPVALSVAAFVRDVLAPRLRDMHLAT